MNVTPIVEQLDAEISRLQIARETIASLNGVQPSVTKHRTKANSGHKMSAEARRRISVAAKARWAKIKRAA